MRIAGRAGVALSEVPAPLRQLLHRPPTAPGAMCRWGHGAVQRDAYGCGYSCCSYTYAYAWWSTYAHVYASGYVYVYAYAH